MGKVRKLRKKYKALCSSSNQVSSQKSSISNQVESIANSMNNFASESDMLDDDCRSTARSTYSISKSIKSSLGGQSILKKDKQKLRHELFLKKLDSSKQAFDSLKMKRKKVKRIDFKDELPPLKVFEDGGKDLRSMETKLVVKNKYKPRKGMTKHRNQQLVQNVDEFREMLKNKTSCLGSTLTRLNDN